MSTSKKAEETPLLMQCTVATCAYIYDPRRGDKRGKIEKGIAFADLPPNWHCPLCGASKASFQALV